MTCDVNGSIEFLMKRTNPDNHFYVYDPISEKTFDDIIYRDNHILY